MEVLTTGTACSSPLRRFSFVAAKMGGGCHARYLVWFELRALKTSGFTSKQIIR